MIERWPRGEQAKPYRRPSTGIRRDYPFLPNGSQPAQPVFAAVHRRRQHAQDLEHDGRTDQRGVAGRIEGRRDLDDVAADEVEPVEAADHALRLGGREAADLRRAGARRVDRVEPVDIEADIGRAVADDAPRLGDDGLRPERKNSSI